MPFRQMRLTCKVRFRVEEIDGRGVRRVVHIEGTADELFIEKPRSPRGDPRGSGADQALNFALWRRFKDAFQDQEIDWLVTEREAELVGEGIARPITLVKDGPS